MSSDGEEGLGQKAGSLLRQLRRTGGVDAAKLGLMSGSCGHFQVMTSLPTVEVQSPVSERHSHWPASPSLKPSLRWPSVPAPLSGLPGLAPWLLPFSCSSLPLLLGLPLPTIPPTFVFPRILGRPRRSPRSWEGQGTHSALETWIQWLAREEPKPCRAQVSGQRPFGWASLTDAGQAERGDRQVPGPLGNKPQGSRKEEEGCLGNRKPTRSAML